MMIIKLTEELRRRMDQLSKKTEVLNSYKILKTHQR